MSILVVEANEGLQELLEVAIEHASPGVPVAVLADPGSAARGMEKLKGKRSLRPKVVVLGPSTSATIRDEELGALREALGTGAAIVALSMRPETEERELKGLDAVYEHPSEWTALSATMAEVVRKWNR